MPEDIMRHYPKMIDLAAAMNCTLQPSRDDITVLRGLCPFHQATRMHNSRTLRIDAKSGRFRCDYCGKSGTPLAFAATTWGVNAQDAHHLLEQLLQTPDIPVTPDRPPYPANMNELTRNTGEHPWINSAIMTRAAVHYHNNIYTSYPALRTLAKLGISPDKAEKAGLGYCTGQGLREFLLEQGDITEEEMTGNPLWNDQGAETLAGRLTLTDRDHTGGALWITSIDPETDETGYGWRRERPYTFGIRGAKPFIFGQYSATRRSPWLCVTDDPRIYIVAAVHELPVIYITQHRRPDDRVTEMCRRITAAIARRTEAKVTLCMHDLPAAGIMAGFIRQSREGAEAVIHGRDSFLKQLKPETRDLSLLKTEPPESSSLRRRPAAPTAVPSENGGSPHQTAPEPEPETAPEPPPVETG